MALLMVSWPRGRSWRVRAEDGVGPDGSGYETCYEGDVALDHLRFRDAVLHNGTWIWVRPASASVSSEFAEQVIAHLKSMGITATFTIEPE